MSIKRRMSPRLKEEVTAFMFVAPFTILFIIFVLTPVIYSFMLSTLNFNSAKNISDLKFIGLENYKRIFSDSIALKSFARSLLYSLISVPCYLTLGFIFAVLLNKKFYCRTLSRTMIFMPYVGNIVAVAIVWGTILDPVDGPVNKVLRALGVQNPPLWLGSVKIALPTVAILAAWWGIAFPIIVYLAALQDVPEELYESSKIDGTTWIQRVRHITIPLISPTTFFLIITSLISSFQNYAIIKSFTNGGPGMATRTISINMYETAFRNNEYSYATAQAVILFIIISIITLIQWKGQKKWVHY